MTLMQATALSIIAVMMVLFVWGRIRHDVVALLGLLAAILTGIVSVDEAFAGFGDDIVVIVASALVISGAVSRSGVTEILMGKVAPFIRTVPTQIAALAGTVMVLSAVVKNIGALSMLIPPAFQIARKTSTSASALLMPMSFASLLGGLVTLVGTSPNVIVSRLREDISGEPFRMFDFTPVGLPIALLGLAFLLFGWRLLPQDRRSATTETTFNISEYTTEAVVPDDFTLAGQSVDDVVKAAGGGVRVTALIRDTHKRFQNPTTQIVRPGDHLLLEGEPDDLEQAVAATGLMLSRAQKQPEKTAPDDEIGVMEAVVTASSVLVDRSSEKLRLYDRFKVNVLAVSRSGARVNQRLKTLRFRPGDVVVLQGNLKLLPDIMADLGCLPLAERTINIGRNRKGLLPLAILFVAMLLMAMQILSVTTAFFGAAVLIIALRCISLKDAYGSLDGPVLITLACLIPVSDALRTTGVTDILASGLSSAAGVLPPIGSIALIMAVAMAVTPFLNNAATVLVAGPIAAGLATQLGYNPDPFLMAVAVGAACDFLTPIGHQCNMLVLGPGGYRFGDYWRLGLPLSLLVLVVGVPLITLVWPV
ncbi:SLC13 family permease [Chthonobacter rhizosphaerae]|uniref:SLC13 family permease n=1 Tax=Chthonobacter rhizosphaerae TaxID=2735553 RepID=UPI0015EE6141